MAVTGVDGADELIYVGGVGRKLVVGRLETNMCWVFSFLFQVS